MRWIVIALALLLAGPASAQEGDTRVKTMREGCSVAVAFLEGIPVSQLSSLTHANATFCGGWISGFGRAHCQTIDGIEGLRAVLKAVQDTRFDELDFFEIARDVLVQKYPCPTLNDS